MIRAKFRCTKTTQSWDSYYTAEFRPVTQKGANTENQQFWAATPAGEATLTFKTPHEFVPGAYYYIDMEPAEAGAWQMTRSTRTADKAGEIVLSKFWSEGGSPLLGSLQMGIVKGSTVDLFGAPGAKWEVTFSFAEASD